MIGRTSTAFLSIYRKKDPDMENPGSFFLLLLRVFKMSFAILMAAAWANAAARSYFLFAGPARVSQMTFMFLKKSFYLFPVLYTLYFCILNIFYRISPAGRRLLFC